MCPDRKLKWFKDHGRDSEQIALIREIVISRWNESYVQHAAPIPTVSHTNKVSSLIIETLCPYHYLQQRSKWLEPLSEIPRRADSIEAYLDSPVEDPALISQGGGYMHYWNRASKEQPGLSKFGSDFCSIPGARSL